MRPPLTADSIDGPGWHRQAFYSVSYALQTNVPAKLPFPLKKLPLSNGHEVARWRMSLKVAKIINIRTIASPMRNPNSWARSDSGRPRIASIA